MADHVYVLQDKASGTYTVLADRTAVDAFFQRYSREHYTISREPVETAGTLEAFDRVCEEIRAAGEDA